MAGELLIQVIDIGRFRGIRSALDELDPARALELETLAILRKAATSPLVRRDRHGLGRVAAPHPQPSGTPAAHRAPRLLAPRTQLVPRTRSRSIARALVAASRPSSVVSRGGSRPFHPITRACHFLHSLERRGEQFCGRTMACPRPPCHSLVNAWAHLATFCVGGGRPFSIWGYRPGASCFTEPGGWK